MDDTKTAEEVLGSKIKWYLLSLLGSLLVLILLLVFWWRSMKDVTIQLNDPLGTQKSLLIWVAISFMVMIFLMGFWWIVSLEQNVRAAKYPDYKIDRWKIPDWAREKKVKLCLFIITILIILFLMIVGGLYFIKK